MSRTILLSLCVLAVLAVAALWSLGLFGGRPVAEAEPPGGATTAAAPAPAAAAPESAAPAQRVAQAKALPPLCMSDEELQAFLKYAALAPIRFGSSSCSTRFPDLKAEADGHVERFTTTHAAVLKTMDEESRKAFARSFGDTAVKRRDARVEADSASTFGRITRYSRDECKSHLASIEGFGQMSDADLDATLAAIARQSFDDQRAAVPACG